MQVLPIKLAAVIINFMHLALSYSLCMTVLASSLKTLRISMGRRLSLYVQGLLSAYLALQLVSEDSISDHPLPQSLRITCMELQDSVILLLETNNLLLKLMSTLHTLFTYFLVCHLYTLLQFCCCMFVFVKDVGMPHQKVHKVKPHGPSYIFLMHTRVQHCSVKDA